MAGFNRLFMKKMVIESFESLCLACFFCDYLGHCLFLHFTSVLK
jgi:hypothetical protein